MTRKFDPMHSIHLRPPHEVKTRGFADKPYRLEWDYPVMKQGKFCGVARRHQLATPEQAEEFAVKHNVQPWRMPPVMRRRLCRFVRTVATIAS